MTILTRERFFTASLHVHLGDARQAKAGLLRRDGDRFIATYDPERASLGTAVVLARVILSSEGITVTEVILEGHDPDLTALFTLPRSCSWTWRSSLDRGSRNPR